MSRLKDFPSIHDRIHTGYSNALHSLYEIGRNLSDKERQEVIARVRAKGYRVEELEFYEYAPTDTMRHLFVRMEGEAESIPYFMLDKECWSEIVDEMSEQAFNDQCTGANPRYPLIAELKEIYLKAYYGK